MRFIPALVIFFLISCGSGQDLSKPTESTLEQQVSTEWDNNQEKNWPDQCKKIAIPSSLDSVDQPAYVFFPSDGLGKRPLIVSLHTWSGGYDQKDPISWMAVDKQYNYIHPHFRGPNWTPDAMGSPKAIQDIDDAIQYALDHALVDENEIHIIGTSGGGYAALLAYMNSRFQVKTFTAWVPISDIEQWYYESVGRNQKYARDIAKAVHPESVDTLGSYRLDAREARARSPLFMETPVELRKDSRLNIFAGIHDGYRGSVPITHSLNMFNKVASDFGATDDDLIPAQKMLDLVVHRNSSVEHPSGNYHGRVHYRKAYEAKVQVTIFEGKHEMIEEQAFSTIEDGLKVLSIGDSNGASSIGWVNKLQEARYGWFIHNVSVPGKTIGFDNLGNEKLNSLKTLDADLEAGKSNLGEIDLILVNLGTNDCKAVFDDSLTMVPQRMQQLLSNIRQHEVYQTQQPKIIVISPPPASGDELLGAKYKGTSSDLQWLVPELKKVCEQEGIAFIDIYSTFIEDWPEMNRDGIHLNETGYLKVAAYLSEEIEKQIK